MALFDNAQPSTSSKKVEVEGTTANPKLAKKQEKRKARKEAIDTILEYIADEKNKVPANVVEAAKKFKPSFFGISVGGGFAKKEHPAHVEKLFALLGIKSFEEIKVGATFDEMKAFQTLKVGRGEMHKICVNLIKKPDDKGAVFVDFNADKGVYTVKGIGEEPEGWTGYRKSEADADETEADADETEADAE